MLGRMREDLTTCFLRDGFVRLDGAVPAELARQCADLLWAEIGYDSGDPATWVEPVRWVMGMSAPPFAAAANTPPLVAAFDTLVGAGRWQPRASLGSFPLRFPHRTEPDDAGWHVEGSYLPDGAQSYWLNLRSRGRALLMLFLFTDVGARDAPTRIRVGSHVDIPPLLAPHGEPGVSMFRVPTGAPIGAGRAHVEDLCAGAPACVPERHVCASSEVPYRVTARGAGSVWTGG
jgi:hypothetical protein